MFKLRMMLVALIITFTGSAVANHKSEHSVKERTEPTGQVFRPGDDVPVAVAAVVESSGTRDGETIYTQKCTTCHLAGIAGAPKAGDSAAWADRIAKGEEALISSAINGIGIMPAKGGCADCSDEEVKSAVLHMLAMLP